ncbi:Beta-lactamase-like protein [Pleurostoma richardsiae]|uniref:Beta-lactamase-like protein n=1 Tax=Pleurostoma richardsiae TaxID=41990 RepID=A0AA38S2W1_9PEZI|nr:Beta-lactamase-like protein [Pleurostoma richardsiae]
MSAKLIPTNPSEVMVIRNITPNVVTFSVPFARFGVLKVGGRGTLVKLTSGALAIFSPVALTPEVKAKIAELGGTVKYIIAPDIEHHIFISEWAAQFPEATLIGPEGLPEKREKANEERIGKEKFGVVATAAAKAEGKLSVSPEFDADFDLEYVDAHPNKELVFFYRPDKILIEADLMFNLPANEQYSRVPAAQALQKGVAERIFGSLQTTAGEAKGMKRFMWYVFSAKDRKGFNASAKKINEWDFKTIIPCHGDTIEGNGKEIFEKIFEWHLKAPK